MKAKRKASPSGATIKAAEGANVAQRAVSSLPADVLDKTVSVNGTKTSKVGGMLSLPANRFAAVPPGRLSHTEAMAKVREVAGLFERGGEAVTGLYLGLCDLIRTHELEAAEVRPVLLAAGWSKSRASEVLRVASAPDSVWREYSARLVGFKVALQKTRLYRMVGRGSQRYRERMARRAGVRLVQRLDGLPVVEWQLEFGRWRVAAQQLNITNNPPKKPL